MNNLDDGKDEILDCFILQTPESGYRFRLLRIKIAKQHYNIDVYSSPEFKALKAQLKRIVGDMRAYDIMNDNL